MAAEGDIPVGAVGTGKSVRGTLMGSSLPVEFIPMLAGLMRRGQLPVERMVRWYDFAEINEAARDMEAGVSIKPILRMPTT
ncbi:MAG: hypothetical protein ABWY80_01720 [Acidimicrobiia bacterium]